jgi:hypothetical protein
LKIAFEQNLIIRFAQANFRSTPTTNSLHQMSMNQIQLFSLLLLLAMSGAFGIRGADVGPICLFKGRKTDKNPSFSWQASLDAATGRARAKETSKSAFKTTGSPREATRKLQHFSRNLAASYPNWLVSGSVTFGILRAVSNPNDLSTVLKPRLVDLNLLSFGDLRIKRATATGCEFELPITGGLLSLPPKGKRDRGCLDFEVITDSMTDGTVISCHLRTTIAGNYCPWVAGDPPVPFVRKWTYLSSQSLVHAYVMWRYHKAWNAGIRKL